MYKNYLIIASKLDKAGINITTQLSQFGEFNFYLADEDIIHTENIDLTKINSYDFIIFASKHQSEKGDKTISIHAPGNWRKAEFGGTSERVCKSSALFQKHIFEKLDKNIEFFHLKEYKLTLECTHHGPLINKPCIFVEIGATETEWKDRKAGFVVAKSIAEAISDFKVNTYREIAIGIGGPHYCPNFNKIQLNSNIALAHIIPQYALPITEEMVREAIAGTEEDLDLILLDWKGLGNSEQRKQALDVVNKFYIQKKKTSEISK
ncbi:D-aminoacyl-tRNA deacylase [uncultured archaeon]|nr:D-aminoacyl-tRNA deacylase [uncultured archaeon]